MNKKAQESLKQQVMSECLADPILFMRTFLPHWFSKKISWAHRGLVAILLRQTDFLLHFGKEQWPAGEAEWTKRDLAKIIKFFVWRETPTSTPIRDMIISRMCGRILCPARAF